MDRGDGCLCDVRAGFGVFAASRADAKSDRRTGCGGTGDPVVRSGNRSGYQHFKGGVRL